MGEKATAYRLSFEAVVAAGVILLSLIFHMVSFTSNSWYWYRVATGEEKSKTEVLHTLGIWKEIVCTTSEGKTQCQDNFNVAGWARATAAFVFMALVVHLTCLVCVLLYIIWRRNKRFVYVAAIGMIISGALKCLSALIWGFSASLAFDGWLNWAFALLLVTMSLDWTAGLVSIVEHAEAKEVKGGQRRQRITSVDVEPEQGDSQHVQA